ncbi:hypothetical protein [Rubellicoccus peritrichatus]|uniref:Uncharacterized protein n=1 Tax=Rubellicoccus peritrichatus TaxID=3080537 RepID=A0AAQ3L9W3_9BACT|nr:hypothetical protein [Puniceicoccus sp. CR14]WOO41781.1 hypothetical protein RZN69_01680 [Puniceicoccus sp. CR14]
MDQLLEYLVPIVVFIVWAAGQVLSKRSQGNEDEEEHSDGNEDRARRIQEEIRRKIAERSQQQDGQQSPPPLEQAPPPLTQKPSPYRTTPIGRERDERASNFPPPLSTSTEPAFFEVPKPARNLEAELEEQQKRLEESQRRAKAARLEALSRMAKVKGQPGQTRPRRVATSLREDVIATLSDPAAARKAILYYEILGTPVGMREDGKIKPAWAN